VITLTGGDPDGDDLEPQIDEGPTVGSIGLIQNVDCTEEIPSTCSANVTYNPVPGYTGADSFTFRTFDYENELYSEVATVHVSRS
jgi:hypothetical protein